MNIMINTRIVLLTLLLLISWTVGRTTAPVVENSIFDVMNHHQVLDVTLQFDWNELIADRREEKDVKALWTFNDANKAQQRWNIKVSLRGRFRRIKCEEMPPLRLDFSKKDLVRNGLAEFDDLKLVTLCMDDDREDRNYLLREYLTYKLYNQLTPNSYRVQLVRIRYVDSASGEEKKQMGFLIEDTAQLRARMGADKFEEINVIEADRFDEQHRKLVAVFQYLIGNADYGLHNSRNVKYTLREGKILPVPYDFDFSALVSASYASVESRYGQTSLKDRVYLGFETTREELEPTIQFINSNKDKLLDTVRRFKLLKASERREITDYLLGFFDNQQEINFSTRHLHFLDSD